MLVVMDLKMSGGLIVLIGKAVRKAKAVAVATACLLLIIVSYTNKVLSIPLYLDSYPRLGDFGIKLQCRRYSLIHSRCGL